MRQQRSVLLALLLVAGAPAAPAAAADAAAGDAAQFADQIREITVGEMAHKSFLDEGTAGVDPFTSNNASAVIARPSMSQMFDTALDFNDQQATFGLRVSPALLVTPFPDWYLTGLGITAAANTDQKSFSIGGKWDLNFRDPRLFYDLHHETVEAEYRERATSACGAVNLDLTPAGRRRFLDCRKTVLAETTGKYRQMLKDNPFAFSIGGNATYDNDGGFGGGNATLALDATRHIGTGIQFIMAMNASYEDALPSDAEKDALKDAGFAPGDGRDQKAGGGVQVGVSGGLGGADDNARSVELGFAAKALGCIDGPCRMLDDGSSILLNPYLALSVTKTIGGRIDVFWDGTGSSLGDAIAGVSIKYAFRDQ